MGVRSGASGDMLRRRIAPGGRTGMTSQPTDEDILIREARAERGQHRSGASMAAMLGVAVVFGTVGFLLIFVPHIVRVLLPGPLALLGFFSLPILVTLGIV